MPESETLRCRHIEYPVQGYAHRQSERKGQAPVQRSNLSFRNPGPEWVASWNFLIEGSAVWIAYTAPIELTKLDWQRTGASAHDNESLPASVDISPNDLVRNWRCRGQTVRNRGAGQFPGGARFRGDARRPLNPRG